MARIIGTIDLGSGVVTDSNVSSAAAIDADKMQHCYKAGTAFALAIGGTPATREEIVFVASQSGIIRGFSALLNDTGSATSITFDLKKNGTSVLSAVVTLANTDADRYVASGTLSTTTFAADDVLSISMTVSSATGAQGPFAWADIEESTAP